MKLSIRLKFLLVMSGLLLICMSFYLLMSITVFKTDKTQLVFDLNKSQVSNLASEIDTHFNGLSQSLSLFAQLSTFQQKKMMDNLISNSSSLVGLQIYKNLESRPETIKFSGEFLETYSIDPSVLNKKMISSSPPLAEILAEGEAVWNTSFADLPPMISFGKLVLVLDEKQNPIEQWVLVANLKIDKLVQSLSLIHINKIHITNAKGEILVQKDIHSLSQRPTLNNDAIFRQAKQSPVRLSVSTVSEGESRYLVAYSKAYNDSIYVFSKADEKHVFQVVQSLTVRTLLFGSIVMTLVILAAFLLSRSLTENIALLSRRMIQVSQGDLTTDIKLKGHDETVLLGQAFNKMIVDLRQSRSELEAINRELDQKVKDRTFELEIQNQKVAEAQEALLRTARQASMGEVAGQAAHEVLNPLTSLLTRAGLAQKRVEAHYGQSLDILQEIQSAWTDEYDAGGLNQIIQSWQEASTLDPEKSLFNEDMENLLLVRQTLQKQGQEITRDMQFIREEGDRISKIINSMRRLGHMKSEVKEVAIHHLLTDCCYIMADLFDQHNIKISKSFEARIDLVKMDRDEFIQSLTNLMRNSLQSMIEARVKHQVKHLSLSLKTKSDEKNIIIEIEDNGVGIHESDQARLFQSHFTTKSAEEGTGIGLSISRRLIRNYDGDIKLKTSSALKKTVFQIELPLIKQSDSKDKAVA